MRPLLLALLLFPSATYAAELPNIVVFISDDLGRAETSIHGNLEIKTPTMDALAATGMVFDHAYVASPSCCPNRYSLLTGLMPARHGAHANHTKPKPGTKFLVPLLKSIGYHVATFGKVAHGRANFPGADHHSPKPREMHKDVAKYFANNPIDGPTCLMVGDRRPHVPWTKEMDYDPAKLTMPSWLVDTPETREHWARYYTDITGMDSEMGRIWDFAKQNMGDEFVFVFTSDHGGQWPRGKWNLYDSGVRIPLVVSWPGHVKPATRTNAMVSWVDIIPTLLDLSGGDVPKNIDGRSFGKVLLGESQTHRDKIFTTHTGDGKMNIFPIRAVRIGPYKFVHNLRSDSYHTNHSDRLRKDGAGAYWDSWDAAAQDDPVAAEVIEQYYTRSEFELFDLDSDPNELVNLADRPEHQTTLEMMKKEIGNWAKQQGDDLKPHQDPYPLSRPLPDLRATKK